MRFLKVLEEYRQKSFSCEQPAEILCVSITPCYQIRQQYEYNGLEGLADKRVGKISANRTDVDEFIRIITPLIINLYERKYYYLW